MTDALVPLQCCSIQYYLTATACHQPTSCCILLRDVSSSMCLAYMVGDVGDGVTEPADRAVEGQCILTHDGWMLLVDAVQERQGD